MTRNDSALAPLRHAAFRTYLGARLCTLVGNAVAPIALAFAVLDLTGSPAALGGVLAARTIPHVVFLLFGGVIADRLPRHLVLVVSNGVCCLTQGVAAALLLSGVAQVWQLAAIEALNGAAAAFTFPALQGLIPQLVPRPELQQANALNGLARHLAFIGGSSAGGLIVGVVGTGWGLAADGLTYGIAALLLARLRLPRVAPTERTSMLVDLRVGWREFSARRWIWLIVAVFAFLNAVIAGCWSTLGPAVADETFGRTSWGFVTASLSLGLVIGTAILLRFRPRHPLRLGMIGIAVKAPLLLVLGVAPAAIPLALLAVAAGMGMAVFAVAWETALNQHVPQDKLSRVCSYDALGSYVALPVGQIDAGALAAGFGAAPVIVVGASLYGVVALATLQDRSVRGLTRADETAPTTTG